MNPKLSNADVAEETQTDTVTWEKLLEEADVAVEEEVVEEEDLDEEEEDEDEGEDELDLDSLPELEAEDRTEFEHPFYEEPKKKRSLCGCW